MDEKPRKLKVGRDSVVLGNVIGEVGDGSVVIGPTDSNGNVFLNSPMALGRGAFADEGSIAIGAGACAGADAQLPFLINQLANAIESTGDITLAAKFSELIAELNADDHSPNGRQKVSSILDYLRNAAALNGAWSLVDRLRTLLDCV